MSLYVRIFLRACVRARVCVYVCVHFVVFFHAHLVILLPTTSSEILKVVSDRFVSTVVNMQCLESVSLSRSLSLLVADMHSKNMLGVTHKQKRFVCLLL